MTRDTLESLIRQAETLSTAGRTADAVLLYEQWITADNSSARAVAFFNLGVLHSQQNDLDRSAEAYARASEINPRLYQAQINGGLVAERQCDFPKALKLWLDAAASASEQPDAIALATMALNHVGRLEESRRQFAAAEAALTQSLRLNPQQPDAIQHFVHLRQKQCRWPVYEEMPGLSVNTLLASTSPLAMLAATDDPAMQWMTSQSFVRRKYPWPDTAVRPRPAANHDRVRIGYLSGDLCTHAVGLLMAELLEAHDRSRVTVTAFDFSPEDNTAHRARLRAACDEMVSIHRSDDAAAAALIRQREIDVLIDLHGLSSGARPGILAQRPAPLIGTYLGFIGTTALPWVDFVVTDRFTSPQQMSPYATERPLYIDGSMIPLYAQPVEACRFARADVGLPDDAVVLACFNNVYKFNPEIFSAWMRILQRADRAVLWLLDDNVWATEALRSRAALAGIARGRIILLPRSTHAEYREKLTLADIYLDTFPYNAGSTARDVLDAGVPIVALSGRTPVSRMCGGLLDAAGLGELVTSTMDDYEALAIELAQTPNRVQELKMRIRHSVGAWREAPARFARSLEDQLVAHVRALQC